MVSLTLKVIGADVVLLLGEYWILQDLAWRASFAASLHTACPDLCSYSSSVSYSALVQFFTMIGNGASLTSPPTLDWVQLFAYVLFAINGWFLFAMLRSRRTAAVSRG